MHYYVILVCADQIIESQVVIILHIFVLLFIYFSEL